MWKRKVQNNKKREYNKIKNNLKTLSNILKRSNLKTNNNKNKLIKPYNPR